MKHWITNKTLIETQEPPEDVYFKQAYNFASEWVQGKKTFELQTSGSTGVPKLITVNRSQLRASAMMTAQALALPHGTKALVCLSVNYIAGIMMLVRGLEAGWDLIVIEPKGNPLLEVEESASFDFISMVPLQLASCLSNSSTQENLASTGKILLGGAPVSVELLNRIRKLSVPVYHSYGMTETVSHVALRRLNGDQFDDYYTLLEGIDFGIDDRGCLYVKGEVTDHKVVQTNDLVEFHNSRKFKWLGRADSIINSGGVKIQLDKLDRILEEVVFELNRILDFFHWFEKDERLGQKLILFIRSEEPRESQEVLLAKFRERVSTFEVPKAIYFVHSFKRTPTDKLDKRATAAYYFTTSK